MNLKLRDGVYATTKAPLRSNKKSGQSSAVIHTVTVCLFLFLEAGGAVQVNLLYPVKNRRRCIAALRNLKGRLGQTKKNKGNVLLQLLTA